MVDRLGLILIWLFVGSITSACVGVWWATEHETEGDHDVMLGFVVLISMLIWPIELAIFGGAWLLWGTGRIIRRLSVAIARKPKAPK